MLQLRHSTAKQIKKNFFKYNLELQVFCVVPTSVLALLKFSLWALAVAASSCRLGGPQAEDCLWFLFIPLSIPIHTPHPSLSSLKP